MIHHSIYTLFGVAIGFAFASAAIASPESKDKLESRLEDANYCTNQETSILITKLEIINPSKELKNLTLRYSLCYTDAEGKESCTDGGYKEILQLPHGEKAILLYLKPRRGKLKEVFLVDGAVDKSALGKFKPHLTATLEQKCDIHTCNKTLLPETQYPLTADLDYNCKK